MNKYLVCLATSFSVFLSNDLVAYEANSHMRLARVAIERSILANVEFIEGMGFEELNNVVDEISDEECDYLLRSDKELNPLDHFYCGAYVEDNPARRAINHFYDPVNNRPLMPNYDTAPDWGLEESGQISNLLNTQNFSYRDAIKLLLESYTDEREEERLGKGKTFFQALGQVAHLVEDMASPEHVRLDQHLYPESRYELYTESVIKTIPIQNYNYPSIDLNLMQSSRDFFKNTRGDMSGLASFTNSNFISVDTNFIVLKNGDFAAGPQFQLPIPNQNTEDADAAVELGPGFSGAMKYISSDGFDGYAAAAGLASGFTNRRASVFNLYVKDLQNKYATRPMTNRFLHGIDVNEKTFDSAHEFLLKRAVSYSTGLINYFFRGHVEISNLITFADEAGFPRATFTLKNTTSEHNSGGAAFSFSNGDFDLYYDTVTGERRRATPISGVDNSLTVNDPLNDQDEMQLGYSLREGTWDSNKPLTLVFEGNIGDEEGIIAKVFEPNRLLAFNVNGVVGNAPLDNLINVYASVDLGRTWSEFGGFALPIVDASPYHMNSVKLYNAVNLGGGMLLAYAGYNDYMGDNGQLIYTTQNTMVMSSDYGRTWEQINFDWSPLLVGAYTYTSLADTTAIYESLVFTGEQGLSGIRVQHPDQNDPPKTPRSFQLFHTNSLGIPGSWSASSGLGQGGLPEVDYLGDSSYVFASYLEGAESGSGDEGGDFRKDTILARTDNGGGGYYPLSDFSVECGDPDDPNNTVHACIQHLVNLGNERLLGWTDLKANRLYDYLFYVPIYVSENGGMNWSQKAFAPFDDACSTMLDRELVVDNLLYIGNVRTTQGNDEVLVTTTTCTEIREDSDQRIEYLGSVAGGLFFSVDGGNNWIEGELPPAQNSYDFILYAGDNGAIPGLYDPPN